MKFTSRDEAIRALQVAPVAMSEIKSPRALQILAGLTKSGLAEFKAGYYSRTWTVAK